MHDPLSGGIGGIGLGVTDLSPAHVDNLRLAVAIHIPHHRNFALHFGNNFIFLPPTLFSLRVDIQKNAAVAPAIAHRHHVRPAVSGKIRRKIHPRIAGKLGRGIHCLGQVHLPRFCVVGAVIDVRAGYDIQDSIVIEVRRTGAPRIVEVAQLLLAEVTRSFIRQAHLQAQILISQVLETHFPTAPGIERDRPVSLVAHGAVLATVIEECTNNIGIEQNLGLIPIVGAQLAIRRGKRQGHGGDRRVEFARGLERLGGGAIRSSPPPRLNLFRSTICPCASMVTL